MSASPLQPEPGHTHEAESHCMLPQLVVELGTLHAKHDAPARLGSRSATTADTSATLPEHVLDASAIDRAGTIVSAEYGCVVRSILPAGVRVRVGRGVFHLLRFVCSTF